MKCPYCGDVMNRRPDETHEEFIKRWESANCTEERV